MARAKKVRAESKTGKYTDRPELLSVKSKPKSKKTKAKAKAPKAIAYECVEGYEDKRGRWHEGRRVKVYLWGYDEDSDYNKYNSYNEVQFQAIRDLPDFEDMIFPDDEQLVVTLTGMPIASQGISFFLFIYIYFYS